jgi:transcription elongation GreA/GreB family factor
VRRRRRRGRRPSGDPLRRPTHGRGPVAREPARRVEIHKKVVLRGEPDTADECFSSLARAGDKAAIAELTREINEKFRDHPFAFAWFAKAAVAGKLPQGVDVPSPPQLLEKVLLLHNHLDQLFYREDDPELRRLSKALSSMLIAKSCRFVKEGLDRAAATDSEARNIDKIIRNNRSLPEDIRDKVLAAMLRTRPELGKREEEPQSRPGVPASDPNILYATDEGVTRRRKEYETLVNVLIPENAAEIGRAASYGDLSENAEWSAAIEKQTQLTRKSEDMIAELNRVRIIDPEMQDGEHATLGSRVKLAAEDGKQFDYVVLGPFEADNEKGVISYLSPLGASILGRKKGEEFAVETPSGSVKYRVLEVSDGLKHLEA